MCLVGSDTVDSTDTHTHGSFVPYQFLHLCEYVEDALCGLADESAVHAAVRDGHAADGRPLLDGVLEVGHARSGDHEG